MEDPESDPHLWFLFVLNDVVTGQFSIGVLISLLIILLLLFCSAMISGSEIAFFSLEPQNLKDIESNPTTRNKLIRNLLKIPKRLLATILIANNFVNVGIVILSAYVFATLFNFSNFLVIGIIIEIFVIAFLILLFGEIMPKILANQKPVSFATVMARPLKVLVNIFYPFSSLLVKTTNFIDKRLEKQSMELSMTDLTQAIDITVQQQDTPDDDTKILKGIVKFTDIEVSAIMKSRMDVVAIDSEMNFHEVIGIVTESGYSRIPVYTESFDKVDGILYVKDLLPFLDKPKNFEWVKLIRPALFVPENKKINDLLQEIREKKVHIAIVVDEYGGTSGIVTLEDILEEIVGEISDEFDTPQDEIEFNKIDDNNYIFEGRVSINDFCKIIGAENSVFDEVKGEADSIAGLLLELLGKMPEKNTFISYHKYEFKVLTVDKRRIKMINVTIHDKKQDD